MKVIQPFFDGTSHRFFDVGMEIAEDPSLAYAEKRGLIVRIQEKKEEPVKKTVKKTTATNTKKK